MKEKLTAFARRTDPAWVRSSVKQKLNLLTQVTGLEAIFTPRVVLESLVEGKDGKFVSVMTGRDGRYLWSGETKLTRHPGVNRKFTFPLNFYGRSKQKLSKASYLFGVLCRDGLPEKAVKPLVRLCLQFYRLKMDAFERIKHTILACVGATVTVRRMSGPFGRQTKPFLLKEVRVIDRCGLKEVPLWDYCPVRTRLTPQGAALR